MTLLRVIKLFVNQQILLNQAVLSCSDLSFTGGALNGFSRLSCFIRVINLPEFATKTDKHEGYPHSWITLYVTNLPTFGKLWPKPHREFFQELLLVIPGNSNITITNKTSSSFLPQIVCTPVLQYWMAEDKVNHWTVITSLHW